VARPGLVVAANFVLPHKVDVVLVTGVKEAAWRFASSLRVGAGTHMTTILQRAVRQRVLRALHPRKINNPMVLWHVIVLSLLRQQWIARRQGSGNERVGLYQRPVISITIQMSYRPFLHIATTHMRLDHATAHETMLLSIRGSPNHLPNHVTADNTTTPRNFRLWPLMSLPNTKPAAVALIN
jgi:hypothetical protein